jgi:porin
MKSDFLKKLTFAIIVFGLSHAGLTFSAEETTDEKTTAEVIANGEDESDLPQGILPIPGYGDDIISRGYLTGDWDGKRTSLASDHGFQWNIDSVTWADTALDGGTTDDLEFGGNLTYNMEWDLMRAGILPGALLQLRAETRFGSSGILNTGQAVPMNTAALSPTNYVDFDDGYSLALTHLTYLQMLSGKFGVIGGKFDLYGDGDPNEFAGGRGRTQFSNWSLNYGTANLFVPASTLGVGVVYLPSHKLSIMSLLVSGTECTHSNCFKDLNDKGGVSITSATYQYQLGGLPGGVTTDFIYLFDKDFSNLDDTTPVPPPPGWEGSTKDHSWIVGGSFWQYISTKESHEGPLNLTNRQQDLAGWGIFGRLTLADDDTNPWKTGVALGLGARGVIPGRPNDMFGVGYFYNGLSKKGFVEKIDDGQGVEGYYNLAIIPSVMLSFNLQWLNTIRPSAIIASVDDTWMFSTRLQVVF